MAGAATDIEQQGEQDEQPRGGAATGPGEQCQQHECH